MSWPVVYIVVEWLIRVGMVPVVARQQRPSAALAWIAVVFAFPMVGTVLYVLLGTHRLPLRRIRHRGRRLDTRPARPGEATERPSLPDPIAAMSKGLSDHPAVGGNAVEVLADNDEAVDRLVADIDAARHHVHLMFYIYRDDRIGRKVADALYRAVKRGVACRVLVDGVGSWRMLRQMAPEMRSHGVDVRASLPVRLARLFLARLDLRNHRKLVVVDAAVGYAGSLNIIDVDAGRRPKSWRDVMVRVTGPVVHQLQDVFDEDWFADSGVHLAGARYWQTPDPTGDVAMQAVPSGPLYPSEAFVHLIVAALHQARERVVLTTPYFVPSEPIEVAMKMAARRGVRVDLVVPARADHRLVTAAGRAYFGPLLAAGVCIHLHQQGMIHTKSLTVDGELAILGSGNLDLRSFYLAFELNLLMVGGRITREVREVQEGYMARAKVVDRDAWEQRPWWRWVPQHAAKLLSPLL